MSKANEEEKQCLEQFMKKNNDCIEVSKKQMARVKKQEYDYEYNISDFVKFYKLIDNIREKFDVHKYNKKWRSNHIGYNTNYYNQKLKDKLIHCDVCNKNVVSLYFEHHKLKSIHIKKLAINNNNPLIV